MPLASPQSRRPNLPQPGGVHTALTKHTESRSVAVAVVSAKLHAWLGKPPTPIPWAIRLLRSRSSQVASCRGAVRPCASRTRPTDSGPEDRGGRPSVPSLREDHALRRARRLGAPVEHAASRIKPSPDSTVKSRRKTAAVNNGAIRCLDACRSTKALSTTYSTMRGAHLDLTKFLRSRSADRR